MGNLGGVSASTVKPLTFDLLISQPKIEADKSKPGQLWQSTNVLLGHGKTPSPAHIEAAQFHRFLNNKVADVRSTTPNARLHLYCRILPLHHSVSSSS